MIEIIEYKPFVPRDGNPSFLKGFLRLKIKTDWGWLTCNEMQVFSKHGKPWVNFPAKKVEEPDGIKHYPYSRFEKEDSDKFSADVIKALTAWHLAKQGVSTDPVPLPKPTQSNGPKNAIPQSMSPDFVASGHKSATTGEDLPF